MKRASLFIVLVYISMLLLFTLPVAVISFWGTKTKIENISFFNQVGYWLWLLVMAVGQAALLGTPVRISEGRPVTRKPLLWTAVAAGLAIGMLAAGLLFTLYEAMFGSMALEHTVLTGAAFLLVLVWTLWALIFFRWAKSEEPRSFIQKAAKTMYKGSILELLIAVPSHIIARQREYCCAGAYTFMGIAFGLAVMAFSFGPAVFFLYTARIKKLKSGSITKKA